MHSQLYKKIDEIVSKFSENQQEITERNFDSERFQQLINEQGIQVYCEVSSCSFWQLQYCLNEGKTTGSPDLKIRAIFKYLSEDLTKDFSVHCTEKPEKKLEEIRKSIDFKLFEIMKEMFYANWR